MAKRVEPEPLNIEAAVKEFDLKLTRVRVLYEQYFLGIEKREPSIPLKEVVRLMVELDRTRINNTRTRYLYRSLVARFNTYRTYWNRTKRAIEQGTYHRDLARLRRKWNEKGIKMNMPTSGRLRSVKEVEKAVTDALRQERDQKAAKPKGHTAQKHRKSPAEIRGKPADQVRQDVEGGYRGGDSKSAPPPAQASATRAGAALPTGYSQDQMKSLYRRYVKAKKMVGEDPASVRYEALKQTVSAQMPKIQEVHKGRQVDFDVVIRSGRVVLKAKVK